MSYAELAYASGDVSSVTWLSLRLQRGPVAVVAALPDDATAEPGLDAWFSALEATASPFVLMPADVSDCRSSARYARVGWPRSVGAAPTTLELSSAEDVRTALEEQGLTSPGELPAAARYLVWSWPDPAQEQTTRTLRVSGGAAPLPLLPGASFPLLVSAFTRGAAALPGERGHEQLQVTFTAGEPAHSDYSAQLRAWTASHGQPLLEMRARGPLFDWAIYGDGIAVTPLVKSYASRAAAELRGLDADACAEQLEALRLPGAPAAAACGEARDAELAVRAVASEQVTLQRFAISAAEGLRPSAARSGGDPSSPVLRAEHLERTGCEVEQRSVTVDPPVRSGGSNGSSSSGSTTVVVEETAVVDDTPPAEVSCGSSTQSEQGYERDSGCSSDTSSSSSSQNDDSCSGDSSTSTSDTSDDSCSGDSSTSTGDTSDDSCSGDSSSSSSTSSSDSSGCGSDSSSGYDGDTCSGSAAPGAERIQKARAGLTTDAAGRPRRLKTSLWTLAFAAVIWPIRRRKRGLSAGC